MTSTPPDSRPTLTARTPEDLLAMVPYVLGFRPARSLVMLTFGGAGATFHARVDLPDDRADLPEMTELLVEPARRHQVAQAVLVGYDDDDPLLCQDALTLLAADLAGAGVSVVEALRVCRGRWVSVFDTEPGDGVPFDDRSHPFTARGVLEGRVIHDSREALAETLVGTDPAAVRAVGDAVMAAAGRRGESSRAAEIRWVQRMVARCLADGCLLGDADAGRFLVSAQEAGVRESVMCRMAGGNAAQHVELWRDLLRRTPEELHTAPASLLAFAAWLSGDGALAWCALDRLGPAERDDPVADVVARLLDGAVPPSAWEGDPDLAELDLAGLDLAGLDLAGLDLAGLFPEDMGEAG